MSRKRRFYRQRRIENHSRPASWPRGEFMPNPTIGNNFCLIFVLNHRQM
jgi:hypothetical protein